ncbi:hypothetical protein Cgig2_032468 [Carnegiea gigantea]|uniref:Uncharacterized protein n=1 Tax=Carnegiea gigantea TaxID=171969 RepID=A0A9Q1KXS6_9CARY|nr:hypothetical protein Cgig2_032468 [Carnegiea gigantea]
MRISILHLFFRSCENYVIFIPLITLYKAPILLFKGWQRLVQDLVGREGPFLETVCVPFAGLLIVLWPIAVLLATIGGVLSSIGFGVYASVIAYQIWDNFFKGCEHVGKELLVKGAITTADLDAWQQSKNNKIVTVGIPAYVFLDCFLRSIKDGFAGFLMSDNVKLTSLNRPEGRVFDWLFDPMSIMKAQLKSLQLEESEELYLFKFCLYGGDTTRMEAWDNGGAPPREDIRRAQLEGIGRRLQGFCLTLSRLPTSRRRFIQVVKEIAQGSNQRSYSFGAAAV